MSTENLKCPFCNESDFDATGLKSHLLCDCDAFEATPSINRVFGSTRRSAPDTAPLCLADLSAVKHEIADLITVESRSKSDIVQDVLDALVDRFEFRKKP